MALYFVTYNNRCNIQEWEPDMTGNPQFELLTPEQLTFLENNPNASVIEVKNCQLTTYQVQEPTIEDTRTSSIKEIDECSRTVLGTFVDNLELCNAISSYIFSESKGIEPIYDNTLILKTATDFLMKGKLCRTKYLESVNLINSASTITEINNIKQNTLDYYNNLQSNVDTIEQHKILKLIEIDTYDNSTNVNGFTYGGHVLWLDKATRVGLVNTLNSAELLNQTTVNIWFKTDFSFTLDVNTARQLLASIEMYATACFNITAQHKVTVSNMTTIAEIDAFDVTQEYPQRLNFDL